MIMRKIIALVVSAMACLPLSAVTVETQPGQLASQISDCTITSLTVTGSMDARDFKFVADSLKQLTEVDLSGVTIVAYEDAKNPVFGSVQAYEAASIPCTSFFGKKLTSVVLPAGLKSIGYAAFAGCGSLQTIALPETVDSIASYAFNGTGLTAITIPASVKVVDEAAFSRCEALASAVVPNANLGANAFLGDVALTDVTLGAGVKVVGDGAFNGCAALTSINYAEAPLTTIGAEAFTHSGITSVDLSSKGNLTTVGEWALANTPVTNVILPTSVTELGTGAFYYDNALTDVNIPADVPDYALAGTAVANDSIAMNAATIGDYAFYNCEGFQSFVVPATVNYIGTKAFAGTTGIKVYKSYATTVPELGDSVWAGIDQPNVNLDIDDNDVADAYGEAEQWKEFHILKSYLMGDANGDGAVDVSDVTITISYILGNDPTPFFFELADVNYDGSIDVSDISGIVNIVLSGNPTVIRKAKANIRHSADCLSIDNFSIKAGETRTIELALNNSQPYIAMQYDITLPEGLTLLDATETTSRTADHQFASLLDENGLTTHMLAYSMNNAQMAGSEGAVARLQVRADQAVASSATITISNVLFVTPDNERVFGGSSYAMVDNATGVDDITASKLNAYAYEGTLYVEAAEATTAQLVAMNGVAQTLQVQPGRNQYSGIAPGIYLVRTASKTFKVAIR